MIHDASKGDCVGASRLERTAWTHDKAQVTCPVCKGGK
jgi:hypothetical protein